MCSIALYYNIGMIYLVSTSLSFFPICSYANLCLVGILPVDMSSYICYVLVSPLLQIWFALSQMGSLPWPSVQLWTTSLGLICRSISSTCNTKSRPASIINWIWWWSLRDPKPGKNIHTWLFEFSKGRGQASSNYIQHVYSYSTLSNYPKAQDGRGNEFVNAIGMHQWSLHNHSGNDAISGDYVDSQSEQVLIDLIHWC